MSAVSSFAQTTVQFYRGGEDDSGAAHEVTFNSIPAVAVNAGTTGSSYDLTFTGEGGHYTDTTSGYGGSTLALNMGSGGYFSGAANTSLDTANFILELYVNVDEGSTEGMRNLLMVGAGDASLNGNGLALVQYDAAFAAVRPGPGGAFAVNPFGTVSTGTWQHVALVFSASNGGTIDYYLDGNHEGQAFTVGFYSISGYTQLGGPIGGSSFNGLIDHARITTFTGTFNTSMLAFAPVPEPSTYAIWLGLGAGALALFRRWRRRESELERNGDLLV